MTSVVMHTPSDCVPHTTRTLAMTLAISLNLALLLIALRPIPPTILHVQPPQALDAVVLPTKPPVPLPPVPILRPVQHVVPPTVSRPALRSLPTIAPVVSSVVSAEMSQQVSTTVAPVTTSVQPATSSDATIAYETATPPAYPIAALRAGVQGTVLLRVLVDGTGKPVQVLVAHSSGSRVLDRAALQHVLAAWRFHPAMRDGKPVRAWAMVPVKFSLDRF